MAEEGTVTVYGGGGGGSSSTTALIDPKKSSYAIKYGMAQVLRGGAIFEVLDLHQAKIAEDAGACAVIVTERITGDRISRLVDPDLIKAIKRQLSIPVMARARVGHFVEAQILEAIGVDYIDECEFSVADENHFINKHNFRTPFVCGCRDLGEALRRVREGTAMIRVQGDLGRSGNIAQTVRNLRNLMGDVRVLLNMDEDEIFAFSKKIGASYDVVLQTKEMSRLPVVHFAAGGISTPADAALMMQLGCDGVLVDYTLFDAADAYKGARGIVRAVRNYNDGHVLADCSSDLYVAMRGMSIVEEP